MVKVGVVEAGVGQGGALPGVEIDPSVVAPHELVEARAADALQILTPDARDEPGRGQGNGRDELAVTRSAEELRGGGVGSGPRRRCRRFWG